MRKLTHVLAAAALFAAPVVHAQEDAPLALELNKLEPVPAAAGGAASCRAYLVAANPDNGARIDALRLDLVLFGTDGVIARRIALDIGPVQPGRTQVRLFDLRDLPCDSIGQILVNDTMICKVAGADRTDCMDRLKTASRVGAKLAK
jgi:hypothetical protein